MKYYVHSICAWCGADLGTTATTNPEMDGKVSHGICPACKDMVTKEYRAEYEKSLARDVKRLSHQIERLKK